MDYELRESVYRYLTEREVEAGVDALADHGLKKLPPSLTWDEVPRFYRALLAAAQVQIEWALAHEELWRAVWAGVVTGWQALSPDEQLDEDSDAEVAVERCWSDSWFGRSFRKPGTALTLWVSVGIEREGFAIGFAVFRKSTPLLRSADGFDFHSESKSLWTRAEDVPLVRNPDLTSLRSRAEAAVREAGNEATRDVEAAAT